VFYEGYKFGGEDGGWGVKKEMEIPYYCEEM